MPARPDPHQPADVTHEKAQAWLEEAEKKLVRRLCFFRCDGLLPSDF
jgi:hypothetical protein